MAQNIPIVTIKIILIINSDESSAILAKKSFTLFIQVIQIDKFKRYVFILLLPWNIWQQVCPENIVWSFRRTIGIKNRAFAHKLVAIYLVVRLNLGDKVLSKQGLSDAKVVWEVILTNLGAKLIHTILNVFKESPVKLG